MKMFAKKIRFKRDGNRGVAVVYVALALVALLAFVGLAIDIGYMFVAKTQLQNTADAASLAGAAKLTEKSKSFNQPLAREEAWKIACENKMVPSSANVFLISASGSCTSPPTDLNNTNNDPDGDIVLGHWDSTAGFTPATTTSTFYVNAVKVVARRTSDVSVPNVKIGSNPVSLFFGRVLALLPGVGGGVGTMNAAATAIAARNNPPIVNLTLCLPNCGDVTPLTAQPGNLTPGTRYYTKGTTTPLIGWTTFQDVDTSAANIQRYLSGEKRPPDLCALTPPVCLNTTNGVDNPVLCTLKGMVNDQADDYIVNGVTIHGMKIFIPIVDTAYNPCTHKGTACVTDPTYQPGDAFPFIRYAEAIVTDAVPQGNCPKVTGPFPGGTPGVVLVGTNAGTTGNSTIGCLDCNTMQGEFINSTKLVK